MQVRACAYIYTQTHTARHTHAYTVTHIVTKYKYPYILYEIRIYNIETKMSSSALSNKK